MATAARTLVRGDLGQWTEAERLAREGEKLATALGDAEQLANAKLTLSTTLMSAYEAEHKAGTPSPIREATSLIAGAESLYASIDGPASIEQFSCMLTQGDLLQSDGREPRPVYQRIVTDEVSSRTVRLQTCQKF